MTLTISTNFVLSARELTCDRGGRRIFQGLSFSVTSGQGLLLTGPNGSGKSSLMRVIAGLSKAVNGSVTLNGEPVFGQLVYVGHAAALKPTETLRDMLRSWALISGGIRLTRSNLSAAARAFDLEPLLDTELRYFSSGQRRRAALSRALLTQHTVWLLDEPTVGLDQASRTRLHHILADHLERGGILIVASHDPLGDLPLASLNLADFGANRLELVPSESDGRDVSVDNVWL